MTEELLKALQLIKETCGNAEDCENCPLYSFSSEHCGVTNEAPMDWRLEKKEEYF